MAYAVFIVAALIILCGPLPSVHFKLNIIVRRLLSKFSCSKVLYMHDQMSQLHFDVNVSHYNMHTCSELRDLEYNCYVLSYVELQQMDLELEKVYYRLGFGSQYFVVFVGYKAVLDVFEVLWKYFLRNAVVITEDLKLYKNERGRIRFVPNVAALRFEDEIANSTLRIVMSTIMPFVSKDYKVGLEVEILNQLLRTLRLNPAYVAYLKDSSFSNFGHGNYSSEMQMVYDHQADIILGGLPYLFDKVNDFDKTYIHAVGKGGFFIPVANQVASWKRIAMIFHYTTWIATCLSLLGTTLFYLKLGGNNAWTIYNILFAAAPKQPKLLKPRLIFITWTYTALILISSYQSLLILYLFKPVYHKQASTLQEIIASGITFGGFDAAKDFFLNRNATNHYIHDNYHSCPRLATKCYNRVIYDKDFALYRIDRLMSYQMHFNKSHKAHMISPSHIMYMCFYLPKASPFTQKMSELVILMWDVGLIEKWDIYRNRVKYKESDKASQPITLEHLLLVWGIYSLGIVLSTIAFIRELVNSSHQRYFF